MRAVVYDAHGMEPVVRRLPRPVALPGGVVVRVDATGVCRSDRHAWSGEDPVTLPHVPGHELVGTVTQVGAGVRRWRGGERVTVPFVCGCGVCPWCLAGEGQVCPDQRQPGFTDHGSFAEYVALHAADTNLVAVPDDIGDAEAAALGCRFATAYRALTTHGGLARGQWLAVHGAGGVGLSCLLIARALGARVIVVDIDPAALALADRLGASATVDASAGPESDILGRIHDLTDGGAHVAVDAVGLPLVARRSVLSLRRRGRHVQAGLLLGENATPPLPMDRVIAWELSIHGTHGLAARDYPHMLELAARVDLSSLVGRVVGLEEAGSALVGMDDPAERTVGVTVVDPRR